jgi:hypothetical protein
MNWISGWKEKTSRRRGKIGKRRHGWESEKEDEDKIGEEREKSWPKYQRGTRGRGERTRRDGERGPIARGHPSQSSGFFFANPLVSPQSQVSRSVDPLNPLGDSLQ